MAVARSNTARRREVRRSVPRPESGWLASLRRPEVGWAIVYGLSLALVATAVAVWIGHQPRFHLGQTLTRPIVARVGFEVENQRLTEEQRQLAARSQPSVYVPNEAYFDDLRQRLDELIVVAAGAETSGQRADGATQISQTALRELRRYVGSSGEPLPQWREVTRQFLRNLFDLAILRPGRDQAEREPSALGHIVIVHPDPKESEPAERLRYAAAFFSVDDTAAVERNVEQAARFLPHRELIETFVSLVMLNPQPTYHYSEELTRQRRLEAAGNVEPVVVPYERDEVLLHTGSELTAADLELIDQEHEAFLAAQNSGHRALHLGGMFGLTALVILGIWGYIFAYNPRIVRNPMRGLAITLLLLFTQVLAVGLTQLHPEMMYVTGTFPTLLTAMVLAIVYDQRFALAMGAFHAVLVMLSLGLPIGYVLVILAGVGAAIAQLTQVRTRSKLVQVGLWSGLAMGVVALLAGVSMRRLDIAGQLSSITTDALYVTITGLLTGLVVQGALPAIEQLFRVTTAMTLRELNDASHPLLQRLAQEAPGTYQHSLRIADMAESAAEAIGADGLLCRVGAMYHDIGKINKPMYFIENQGGGPNRHSKLSPAMSLLIIVGHVKDGIEMAREYRLPAVLRHFIESHHGTTLVEYFYHAARKQKEAEDAAAPSEFEFRYPGPKPQTKEAAIMLLCDSIEAAARSLAEPTPIRLEQLVATMANKRLMDGQFNESNLTLRELHLIEQSIVKTLCAIYHSRIKYPSDKSQRAADKTEEAASTPPAAQIA